MNDLPILGDIYQFRFDDSEFNIRDSTIIFYSNYERVMDIIGADISVIKQELDDLIGGGT